MSDLQKFGGDWTQEKLARVSSYLTAYTNALKNTPFTLIYIDAFAETGYRNIKSDDKNQGFMFPDQLTKIRKRFMQVPQESRWRLHPVLPSITLSNRTRQSVPSWIS